MQRGKKPSKEEEEDEDELEDVEELRKGGFLQAEGALAKGKAKLEARPGERRIKRTITFPDATGNPATRVIYFTEKDKASAVTSPCPLLGPSNLPLPVSSIT